MVGLGWIVNMQFIYSLANSIVHLLVQCIALKIKQASSVSILTVIIQTIITNKKVSCVSN